LLGTILMYFSLLLYVFWERKSAIIVTRSGNDYEPEER
jgi:hypothetical protein